MEVMPLNSEPGDLSREELLAITMAHDLRNPLAALHHLAYLMEHRFDPRHVQKMKKQLTRCESVINNVLALSGGRASDRKAITLRDLILTTIDAMPFPDEIQVEIIDEEPVVALVDAAQVSQALSNVFQNALEAQEGRAGTIRIWIGEAEQQGCIRICDGGPGLSPEDLQSLFQPRVSSKKGGVGIGLASARMMIESNHGSIEAINLPDGGAQFSIYLPKES